MASGGVIIVRTKGAYFAQRKEKVNKTYGNQQVYSDDAIAMESLITVTPDYLKELENSNTPEEAFSRSAFAS